MIPTIIVAFLFICHQGYTTVATDRFVKRLKYIYLNTEVTDRRQGDEMSQKNGRKSFPNLICTFSIIKSRLIGYKASCT
jgi:hypothetical protein